MRELGEGQFGKVLLMRAKVCMQCVHVVPAIYTYFCHIPSNHVITVIFYTPVDETIIDSKV